jgi:hypothetical protein
LEIEYRPGVNNADADALSRLPALANITDNTSELPSASVQAICNFISVPAIETISFSAEITNHLSDPFISNRVLRILDDELGSAVLIWSVHDLHRQ